MRYLLQSRFMETKSSVELPGRRTGLTFTRGEVLETRARGGGTAVCLYVVLLNGAPEMVKMVILHCVYFITPKMFSKKDGKKI